MKLPPLFVGLLLSGACGLTDTVCTTEARPALGVVVQDSVTGAVIAGAAVVARDGAYRDSASSSAVDGVAFLADERPGRYDVDVRHPGYGAWMEVGVVVNADECGPVMRMLAARLRPE